MATGGIEPTTFALLARRSNQLGYAASWKLCHQLLKWVQIFGEILYGHRTQLILLCILYLCLAVLNDQI